MFDQLPDHPQWHQFQSSLILKESWMTTLSHYMGENPGKQIRPRLVFLTAFLMKCPLSNATDWAQLIEYIHWASLFHDDIIDQSTLRRGKLAAHHHFGCAQAILGGDFLVNHVFGRLIQWSRLDLMKYVHETLNQLLEGQIQEESLTLESSVEEYNRIAFQKTGSLFVLCVQGICAFIQTFPLQNQALEEYAKTIGLAFQMQDDLYDYFPPYDKQWGKEKGRDFSQKKISFPILWLYQNCRENEKTAVLHSLKEQNFSVIGDLFQEYHIKEKCEEQIQIKIQDALSALKRAFSEQEIRDFGFFDFAYYCQNRPS
jgi:octaprenyl-diphosphate synthase